MHIEVEFFAITISAMVADMSLDAVMYLEMFLEISLLSESHAAADLLA